MQYLNIVNSKRTGDGELWFAFIKLKFYLDIQGTVKSLNARNCTLLSPFCAFDCIYLSFNINTISTHVPL